MIVSLHGTLVQSAIFHATIECAGIGYEVNIPVTTAEKLPPVGAQVHLHTLQIFREDSQSLYGFFSKEERDFFRLLIEKVNGIGPKTAINIFSRLSLPLLKDAIASGDTKLLSGCPGIGKKTAERLVIELRDKVNVPGKAVATDLSPGHVASPAGTPETTSMQRDAVAALVSLGLKLADADKAIRQALPKAGPNPAIETLIRLALNSD